MRRKFGTEMMFESQREGLWEAYRWRPIGNPKGRLGNWLPTGITIEQRRSEPGSPEGWYVFSPYLFGKWAGNYVTDAAELAEKHLGEMPIEHRRRGCPICEGTCQEPS